MKKIALVACASLKLDHTAPARELYEPSHLFRCSRDYVERLGLDGWFVLSARHGLVSPSTLIAPYEQTLNDASKAELRAWSRVVADELLEQRPDQVVILAGRRYREFLMPMLEEAGVKVEVPMAGLGIGQQKAWLVAALKATA